MAVAANRVGLFALLLCVTIIAIKLEDANAKVCPLFCINQPDFYMTCPSTGHKHLKPACNCCLAGEPGCKIFSRSDHTLFCTAT